LSNVKIITSHVSGLITRAGVFYSAIFNKVLSEPSKNTGLLAFTKIYGGEYTECISGTYSFGNSYGTNPLLVGKILDGFFYRNRVGRNSLGYSADGTPVLGTFIDNIAASDCATSPALGSIWVGNKFTSVPFLKATGGTFVGNLEYINKGTSCINSTSGYTQAAYSSGTVYTLTNTSAKINFGTTSPSITMTCPKTSKFKIRAIAHLYLSAATFAANGTITLKLRKTSGTAEDVIGSIRTVITDICTTRTGTLCIVNLPEIIYSNPDDTSFTIQLWGSIDTVPSEGNIQIIESSIIMEPIT
jgi:hypothetical protein